MRKETANRLAALSSVFGVAAALMFSAPAALAQQNAKPAAPEAAAAPASTQAAMPAPKEGQAEPEMAEAVEPVYERLQVGDATQGLLAWQRGGEIASPTSRPIAGNVANRSYERYLKSFEFPIPERMGSIVKSSSSSGSGNSTPK
jgi:hypothetical protein